MVLEAIVSLLLIGTALFSVVGVMVVVLREKHDAEHETPVLSPYATAPETTAESDPAAE